MSARFNTVQPGELKNIAERVLAEEIQLQQKRRKLSKESLRILKELFRPSTCTDGSVSSE